MERSPLDVMRPRRGLGSAHGDGWSIDGPGGPRRAGEELEGADGGRDLSRSSIGCVAILVPAVASVATAIFIGWILSDRGRLPVAGAFTAHSIGTVVLRLLWAFLTVIVGLYLIVEPHGGTLTLTLVLGIYFLFMGVTRITVAFLARGQQGAGLVGLSGFAGLLIGILILAKLPESSDWAIGLLVGIDLIFAGWTLTSRRPRRQRPGQAHLRSSLPARSRGYRARGVCRPCSERRSLVAKTQQAEGCPSSPRHYDLPVSSPLVLVMAAGAGTRMRSSLPKMLHPVCGRPMVAWPILAAREAGAGRVAAIVSPGNDISAGLPEGTETVVQPEPDGTGGAIRAALPLIEESETVLVLSGDHPLITADDVGDLLEAHARHEAAATMLTIELEDPGSYGRVVRGEGGEVERVVEAKAEGDAGPEASRSARSTPAPTPSTPALSPRRWPASPTTTPRASTT